MRGMKQWGSLVVSMVLLALISGTAWAHKASDSFIYLNQDRGEIRIDVALRDVSVALPLDRNGDRQLSGAELPMPPVSTPLAAPMAPRPTP